MTTLPMALRGLLNVGCVDVVACVDGSDYLASVCDHAVWLSSRCGGRLNVLSVEEPEADGDDVSTPPLVAEAAARIEEAGSEVSISLIDRGVFAREAERLSKPDDILVVGRRGIGAERQAGSLGASVRTLIEKTEAHLLVCGRIFLPIDRALVMPPSQTDPRYAEFIASSPLLDGLQSGVAVVGREGLEIVHNAAGSAIRKPMRESDFDLAIVPRSLLLAAEPNVMVDAARSGLLGRRPMLII